MTLQKSKALVKEQILFAAISGTFCTEFDKAYWSLELAKELRDAGFTIRQKYEDILEVSWYVD